MAVEAFEVIEAPSSTEWDEALLPQPCQLEIRYRLPDGGEDRVWGLPKDKRPQPFEDGMGFEISGKTADRRRFLLQVHSDSQNSQLHLSS